MYENISFKLLMNENINFKLLMNKLNPKTPIFNFQIAIIDALRLPQSEI